MYGNVFLAEPAANLVSRLIVEDDGTTLRSKKAYDGAEFLASTDERFRPVYLSNAPDGTLYIVDAYHGIIQHKGFITEYLRDQILSRKLDQPSGHGRIYRVVHDTTKRDTPPALSKATPAQLVDVLAHPNGWRRDTAQRLLVERGDRSVVPALKDRAESAPDWRTRLHALWTLDGIDAIEPSTVTKALDDSRATSACRHCSSPSAGSASRAMPLQAAVFKKLDDPDWAVRHQFAATIGAVPPGTPARETTALTLIERFGNDPLTVDALLSGYAGAEAPLLERVLQATDPTPQRTAAITTLAATVVKAAQDSSVQNVLQWTAQDSRPDWQRQALLAGIEATTLGVALPGSPPARGAAPPAATRQRRLQEDGEVREAPGHFRTRPTRRPPPAAAVDGGERPSRSRASRPRSPGLAAKGGRSAPAWRKSSRG